MLTLEQHIKLDDKVCREADLTSRFTEQDLKRIGDWCWEGYDRDVRSRSTWLRRAQAAMDLSLQLQREKSFPWPGCSNVSFPLLTIAAMEFHSRAYPALIQGTNIVKARVPGNDPTGELNQRAIRVGSYMSYQRMEEDQAWEEQMDRLLLQLPIVGSVFKKSRWDPVQDTAISDMVPAVKLVMDYYAKSVESCARKTHVIELYRNDVWERCRGGVFRDFLEESWYTSPSAPMETEGQPEIDKRTGLTAPFADHSTPLTFLEQHCWMDADGDGYAEPYIITIEGNSKNVARIVARWDAPEDVEYTAKKQVLRIKATEQFTGYVLIPSPDGSVYGMGFGTLVGPINEAVNTMLNQIVDAGTLANTAGGFLSRGVKIRGGAYTFTQFGWNRVDSTGEDLQKGIFPLPVREPSNVLFQVLSFLVNYTQRISGSTDMLAGENPGQNTPAGTSQEMVAQGMKIYSALFKRVWRCMKEEFSKIYVLNAKYLPAEKAFGNGKIAREDFMGDPSQIVPTADPNVVSESMRVQMALTISERARMIPGYDIGATERNLHQAMQLQGAEALYPGPDKVPPLPNPKVQVEEMKLKFKMQELQLQQQQFMAELQEEQKLNQAKIIQLVAQAEQLAAEAQSTEKGHQIALIESMIGMMKLRNEHIKTHIDAALKAAEIDNDRRAIEKSPAGASGGGD